MPFVLRPGRNPIIQAAWAGLRADERKALKASRAAAPEPDPKPAAKKAASKKPAKKKAPRK